MIFDSLPFRAFRTLRDHGIRGVLRYGAAYLLHLIGYPATPETFDNGWSYLRQHGPVRTLRAGRAKMHPAPVLPDPPRPSVNKPVMPSLHKFRVLFLIGTLESESKRYRVYNVQEYLKLSGIESDTCYEIEIDAREDWMLSFGVIVLMRAAMNERVARLLKHARERGIALVYDIDDYVFEPAIVDSVAAIRAWPDDKKREYLRGVGLYRQVLESCDYFLTTTEFLAEKARDLGKEAIVLPNGLNGIQLDIARDMGPDAASRATGSALTIGYFSGTATHDADFAVAAPAIARILSEFPEVCMVIGGFLEFPPALAPFADRVERLPFVPWQQLPLNLVRADINLAPLEIDNPFCEAKSELKYFESALLGVPTVASATGTFSAAIDQGVNGCLARNEGDWYTALRELILRPEQREQIAAAAKQHALATYSPRALQAPALEAFLHILRSQRRRLGQDEHGLSIAWVIPEPFDGSGGHRNIFRVVRYLGAFGHDVTVYLHGHTGFGSGDELEQFVSSRFFPTGARFAINTSDIAPCDALFATHYSTAQEVLRNSDRARRLFYFVQDYETLFHPMGNEYLVADRSYRLGLRHITTGPWCTSILREKYGARSDAHDFPLDHDTYYPREVARSRNLVAFFARPSMPRRCYPLGIESLRRLKDRRPDVDIVMFGEDIPSSPEVRSLGVLSQEELARLYSEATVGLAFSTTNPSLVPFEMMACGCPVVDLDISGNDINYESRDNVTLVEPDPDAIAGALERLLDSPGDARRQAQNARTFVSRFPSEEEMVRQVEALVLQEFESA